MLSKQKIKYLQSLKIKKYRQEQGVFVVEGEKIALEVLTQSDFPVVYIVALPEWIEQYASILKKNDNKILPATEQDLKTISNFATPNKVLVVVKQAPPQYFDAIIENNYTLYLDGIQDPGNMGTILRIADWFSIPYVFCADTCVDVWNPKVLQASMGAFLRVKTFEVPFHELKARFPTLPSFFTVLWGDNIFEKKFPKQGIIVVGNEGGGISKGIIDIADYPIAIPKAGGAESLNAAVATGIICAVLKNV
jgi:RNA methyltransferase, TrmH family